MIKLKLDSPVKYHMIDYIRIISEKIKKKIPVILYTAGADTFSVIRALKSGYDLLPTAVCDGDPEKQGRTYRGLEGLVVISPKDAITSYSNANFFISSINFRLEIIGYLILNSIPAARIINYEPVVNRISCTYLERHIIIRDNMIQYCCIKESPSVVIKDNYDYIDEFISLRDRLIKDSNGEEMNNTCKSCGNLREGWYSVNPKINEVNYFIGGVCNFKCIYCKTNTSNGKFQKERFIGLDKYISELQDRDMISDYFSIDFATNGEPTIHPRRKELYGSLNAHIVNVITNAYILDSDLLVLMNNKSIRLLVSIDAGTRKTYAKIKGVDCFEKVCKNLKQYADTNYGVILLKYIFIPGVNDKEEDIDGFTQLCVESGSMLGIVSYDLNAGLPIPKNTIIMMRRLKDNLSQKGILCTPLNSPIDKDTKISLSIAMSMKQSGD